MRRLRERDLGLEPVAVAARDEQIAERCNREQFDTLSRTAYLGIVVPDAGTASAIVIPTSVERPGRICRLIPPPRRWAAEQKTLGEHGLKLSGRVLAALRAY